MKNVLANCFNKGGVGKKAARVAAADRVGFLLGRRSRHNSQIGAHSPEG